jgi:integrase
VATDILPGASRCGVRASGQGISNCTLARTKLDAEGLALATVLHFHRILTRALKVAVQRGYISRNVATLVDAPSAQPREIQPLTLDEAQRIVRLAASQRNGTRWSVALALAAARRGARPALAVRQLRGRDPDRPLATPAARLAARLRGSAHLRPAAPPRQLSGRLHRTRPRLSPAHRRWPGPDRTQDRQEPSHHRPPGCPRPGAQSAPRRSASRAHGGRITLARGPLRLVPDQRRPIGAHADWDGWKALLKAAKVRDARLHDARHTAATLLLAQGVDQRVVMEILGHSQISMTTRYTHVLPEVMTDAADRIGQALWAPRKANCNPAKAARPRRGSLISSASGPNGPAPEPRSVSGSSRS